MFQPLPNDCFDYYPVTPEKAALSRQLWQRFNETGLELSQREKAAYAVGLPAVFGILKSEFREGYIAEDTRPTSRATKKEYMYRADELDHLAGLIVRGVECRTPQPMLHRIIHSWLNYDLHSFGGALRGGKVGIFIDNRDINPENLKNPEWHRDDVGLDELRPPSRRYYLRTACPPQYRDANGRTQQAKPFEGLVATGDIEHISFKPDKPTPSKFLQMYVLPAEYLNGIAL